MEICKHYKSGACAPSSPELNTDQHTTGCEDQGAARPRVRNSWNITLKSKDFTVKPLGCPQIMLRTTVPQIGLFLEKSTCSSSSLETSRLAEDEDGARKVWLHLISIISNTLITQHLSGMITYDFLFLLCVYIGEK